MESNNFETYLDNNITTTSQLPELKLTNIDIIQAINEIKSSSSCAHHDIPAKVLKECKLSLATPLRLFWQKSFDSAQIPKHYKTQIIKPIHKKGNKTKAENYRPVVETPHEGKVFERVLRRKLVNYLEDNNLLNSNQHGFRKQHNCTTQLLSYLNNIYDNLIDQNETDCIYIDFSKAFDKIDHKILLAKLNYYKINGTYIKWIEQFLENRTQTVFLNNTYSYSAHVQSGVPQGSVLGPVLFIIYINDLPQCIKDSAVLTFADDTKVVSKVSTVTDTLNLQLNLNKIISWSHHNNMELNENKFELMSFKLNTDNNNVKLLKSLPLYNEHTTYYATKQIDISPSPWVRDLGVLVDNKLNWSQHISTICKKSKQISGWVLSVFYSREKSIMLTLFNSLIRSKLEYGCELWSPYLTKDINYIEQIQRSFTFRIENMQELNYWDRLSKLNISSLQRRREKIIIIHIWKILNKMYPNSSNLDFKEHIRTNSIRAILKPLPKLKGMALTKYEESFSIRGAKLWNLLPPELTKITNLNLFKIKLAKFLEKIPDKPPIAGYPYLNNNSLLKQYLPLNYTPL